MIGKLLGLIVTGVAANYAVDKLKDPAKKAFKAGKENYDEAMKGVKKEQEEIIKEAKAKTNEVRKGALFNSLKKTAKEFSKKTYDNLMSDEETQNEQKNKDDTTS